MLLDVEGLGGTDVVEGDATGGGTESHVHAIGGESEGGHLEEVVEGGLVCEPVVPGGGGDVEHGERGGYGLAGGGVGGGAGVVEGHGTIFAA